MLSSKRRLITCCLVVWLAMVFVGCRKAPETEESPTPSFSFITSEDLLSVSSPDNNHVWILGLNATILHSNDGGVNWVSQETPKKTDLASIFFIDNKNGWAVGKHGTILHTTDGGGNWIDISENAGTKKQLISMHYISVNEGWVTGAHGTILHTETEGATWEKQGWKEDRIYNDVFFIDSQRGWIVGEYGTILHTEDGGLNWEKQECKDIVPDVDQMEYAPPTKSLYGVYFQNPKKGWAVGLDGVIISTEDGGKNWKGLKSPVHLTLFKVLVIGEKGWAVGLRGSYVSSTNGGESWTNNEEALPTKFWLRSLDFSDQNHGWVVGSRGTIFHTTDGGGTWKMLSGISVP